MSLMTYDEVRPWARAIKARVLAREMPPWFVEKNIGIQRFRDDPSLSKEELAKISAWVDSGAPLGDPADSSAAGSGASSSRWTIGTPDLVVSSPVVNIQSVAADFMKDIGPTRTGLTEDRYIQAMEVKEVPQRSEGCFGGYGCRRGGNWAQLFSGASRHDFRCGKRRTTGSERGAFA